MAQLTPEEVQKGVEATTAKVERYLKKMGTYEVVGGDTYRFRGESTVVTIRVQTFHSGAPFVRVLAPVLREVKKAGNEAMFEEFSKLNSDAVLGKVYWEENRDTPGVGFIFAEHNLLGEFLDYEELFAAVQVIFGWADEMDDKMQAKYGGKRWIDG